MLLLSLLLLALFTVALLVLPLRASRAGSRSLWLVAVAAVPVAALLIYRTTGAAGDLAFFEQMRSLDGSQDLAAEQSYTAALEERTRARPDNGEYWFLLGLQRSSAGDYAGAANAYEKAADLFPGDPAIRARWAEALFLAGRFQFTAMIQQLVDEVLAADPGEPTVLGILGITSFQTGLYAEAAGFWERALQRVAPGSANAAVMQQGIERARAALQEADASGPGTMSAPAPESTQPGVRVQIRLDEAFEAPPDAALFVFLRQPGLPMPVVVQRLRAGDLPTTVLLDESGVMIPGTRLDAYPELEVVARISLSGAPTAAPGDMEAVSPPLVVGDGVVDLTLVIDRRIP